MILVYFGKKVSTMIRENDQSDLALEFSCMIIMPEPRSGDDKSATVFSKS